MTEESYLLNELTPSAQLRLRAAVNNMLAQDGHVVSVEDRGGAWWIELGVPRQAGDLETEARS